MNNKLPILGICAAGSNAGKTTLITRLIPELAKRGIRVSVIKHAHHQFDIDYPGKDSYSIRESGAIQTLIASGRRWALMTEMTRTPNYSDEANLEELLDEINPDYADLILIEGFKQATIPKIEVYRPSVNQTLLAQEDKNIIAVATDEPLKFNVLTQDIRKLDLNNISAITDFIMAEVLTANS